MVAVAAVVVAVTVVVVCTLLKARHAVVDVPRVRIHGREADS